MARHPESRLTRKAGIRKRGGGAVAYSNAITSNWMDAPPAGAARTVRRQPAVPATVVHPVAAPDSLSQLIARMAAGEQSALSALYEAKVSRVYGLALRIAGSAALAEEVVID